MWFGRPRQNNRYRTFTCSFTSLHTLHKSKTLAPTTHCSINPLSARLTILDASWYLVHTSLCIICRMLMNLLDDMSYLGSSKEREVSAREKTTDYNSHSKRERLNLPVGKIGNLLFGSSLFYRFGGACGRIVTHDIFLEMKTRLIGRTMSGFCCCNECWWMSTPLCFSAVEVFDLSVACLSSLALAPLLLAWCVRPRVLRMTHRLIYVYDCYIPTYNIIKTTQNKNNALPSTISSSVV